MSNEVQKVQIGGGVVSTTVDHNAVIAQVRAMQTVMSNVMRDEVHYGIIPGTSVKTLYKPGSEALLSAFKIAVDPHVERSESADGHISFSVICKGVHMQSGIVIGSGVGCCSTGEEKYAWRAAVCPEEYEDTPEDKRRIKYSKGKWVNNQPGPATKVLQVRTNARDLENTVLKMAKKRAQIDMTLTALAASDMFTQDIEDLPEEYVDGMDIAERKPPKPRYEAKAKAGAPSGPEKPITEGQIKLLKAKLSRSGHSEADFCTHFKVGTIEELMMSQMNQAIEWVDGKNA